MPSGAQLPLPLPQAPLQVSGADFKQRLAEESRSKTKNLVR